MEKIAVTERALIQRINRVLRRQGELLRTARNTRVEQDCGRYYVVHIKLNGIIAKDVDLEDYGHELGVLQKWEKLQA